MATKALSVSPRTFRPQLRLWWERLVRLRRRVPRRLRLAESLPLGEHRFVAVVEFEQSRFLVGGTTSSIVLLAQLGEGPKQTVKESGPELHALRIGSLT